MIKPTPPFQQLELVYQPQQADRAIIDRLDYLISQAEQLNTLTAASTPSSPVRIAFDAQPLIIKELLQRATDAEHRAEKRESELAAADSLLNEAILLLQKIDDYDRSEWHRDVKSFLRRMSE